MTTSTKTQFPFDRDSRALRSRCRTRVALLAMIVCFGGAMAAPLADCDEISVNRTPINDLGAGLYLGQFQGGLYPGGLNVPPLAHHNLARQNGVAIQPRLTNGTIALAGGKIVMLSIGMSNTTQEFCSGGGPPCSPSSFMGKAEASTDVDHTWLTIVDGAAGGQSAATWDDAADPNYNRVRDMELAPKGLTEAQVQVVWIKVANPGPTVALPAAGADAHTLSKQIAGISRAVKTRYPNCRLAFVSSRIYAGYASTQLNPEPYAFESGFGVKWAIAEQISQQSGSAPSDGFGPLLAGTDAPVLVWGPYLWADGLTPRSDGLIWECTDLNADGTHPSMSGVAKVADMLMAHFLSSPYARVWFRAVKPADIDSNGVVDGADLAVLLGSWGPCGQPQFCEIDLDWDGVVNGADLAILLGQWG